MNRNTKTLLLLFFIFLFNLLCYPETEVVKKEKNKPTKVFLILFDALRSDHMSCYGYYRKTTPFIDTLASEGIIFKNHYTQGLNTFFSVPTILYSRYFPPMLHESLDSIECRRAPEMNEKLITEILKEQGYYTVFITTHSWFSKDSPLVKSFDETMLVNSPSDTIPKFEDLNNELFSWLENNKNKNFFMYIHLVDTHFPHILFPPYDKWITEEMKTNILEERRKELALGTNERDILKPLTSFEIDFLNAIYDGSLFYTDYQFSLFIQKLKELDIFNDSIFFLIADHGELLGEDGMLWGHPPIAYNAMLKTPLIIFGKGIPKNVNIKEITENVDIVPTILDLLKLETNAKFDGKSLFSYIFNNKSNIVPRPYAFSKCLYLEPESYLNLTSVEKGYESHQMFVLTDTNFKMEYHEIDKKYYFWTKEIEQKFIADKKFVAEKKFPSFNISDQFPAEFENAKIYLKTKILPKYEKYKQNEPEIYYIPFSPFTIPKRVSNKDEVICHSGEYDKYTTDNKWGFDTDGFVLWTQPWQEAVIPLQFEFDIQQGEYELYIKMPCLKDFYGHPLSSIKISMMKNESNLVEESDCENMEIKYHKVGLAEVDRTNKFIVSLEPGNKNMWCNIMGLKLVRTKAVNQSDSAPNLQTPKIEQKETNENKKLPTEERIDWLRNLGYL